jgi:UDP-GlcNAc:undecaprenyl-phosphate/decaprenyl-phosphate GlcNAc-1-phosphate transferase
MSLPLIDLSVSIVRRTLKGQRIFSADRGHMHHRLLDRGFRTPRAAIALYLMALPGMAAALLLSFKVTTRYQTGVIALFGLIAGLGIVLLRYPEFEVAWRLLFRGEFRRVLAGNVRLEQLGSALQKSRTDDERWKILLDFCRQEGWVSVQWRGAGSQRKQMIASRPAVWSFQIPLGGEESVSVEGDLKHERQALDLVTFSEVVTRTFPAQRTERKQPALS